MSAPPATGLLVIGDVVTDVVALHDRPPATGTDTPADITLRPGGSGANTASWAARLGADTRLLARAGYDTGEWHAAELTKAGVRPHLRIDPGRPSAVVIAMVDASGERSMLTNRGASGHIGVEDWAPDLLDGVGRLHLSAYTMFAGPGLELARLAMREAAGRGIPVSVDPASCGPLREFGRERFLRETAPAATVIPNREEALLLSGASDPDTAGRVLSARYGTAVVKLGADGALLAREGRIVARAPAPPAAVVDSTGAGDAFAAGFLAATLAGGTPEEALRTGCEAGAMAVAQVGGRPKSGNFTLLTPIAGLRRKLHH
ncbi:carbohydrate kinase family protein [Microbispora triticiradicis]|uniref:carbohydrate kinase family protein n=1 Tax=Microbispora triticiradicis TaxID=2200763 RepID=UPI001AD70300|nr:sugar kinase [Microbispora triticiradicis]MBO4273263.1 sugar kinase [Microbispora triticiradicis]